ncbi:MAG: Na+/H+ antiporter, partial [Candidatus Dormibacteraeota bacterium]|nr:Na+/H+ antiporter [Candidatus Dormibacteraeota bacterium]
MPALQVILGLLAAVVVLAMVARRLRLPYPIVLVLGGLALGFIPEMPRVQLDPDVVFLVFLPPLLMAAGWSTSFRDFRANLRSISLLAFGLVLFTTVGVAVVAHTIVPGLPWPTAFVIGAVVSPTDAVAATSIMQRLGAPRRVVTIVEGESMVNDATGLVIYQFAVKVAAFGVAFVAWQAGLKFVLVSVGGISVGLVVAWLLAQVQLRLNDPLIEITLSFLACYVAYLAAQNLGVSGVLAVVVCGLYIGHRSPQLLSPNSRMQGLAVWNTAVFVLNGLAFILVGLQLPVILDGLRAVSIPRLALYGAVVSLAVIVIRILWTYPGAYLPFLIPKVRRHDPVPQVRNVAVTAWSGMRGAVSLAAALALPATIPGGPFFGGRDLVLFLTFSVILVTLVLQGLSLPLLITKLGVGTDGDDRHEEKIARFQVIEAAENRLAQLAGDWAHPEQLEFMRHYYLKRRNSVETQFGYIQHDSHQPGHVHPDGADHLEDHRQREESMQRLRLEMIGAEREQIVQLR